MPDLIFEEARTAIAAGEIARGQRLLWQYLQANPQDEKAWIWLAQTLPDDERRLKAMEECLRHNPDSQLARRAVMQLRSRLQPAPPQTSSPLPEEVKTAVEPVAAEGAAPAAQAEEQKLLSGEENLLKEDINVVLEHKASERAMRQGTALSSKHAAKGLKVYEDNDINSPRAQTANSQIEKLDQEEAARIL